MCPSNERVSFLLHRHCRNNGAPHPTHKNLDHKYFSQHFDVTIKVRKIKTFFILRAQASLLAYSVCLSQLNPWSGKTRLNNEAQTANFNKQVLMDKILWTKYCTIVLPTTSSSVFTRTKRLFLYVYSRGSTVQCLMYFKARKRLIKAHKKVAN